jgi:O-antigen/teichoic acid export membrane protein
MPAQLVQTLLGFGSIMVFTRLLSPTQYGQYALALSVTGIVQCIFLAWAEAAMERFYIGAHDAGEVAAHYATLQKTWGVMAGVIVVLTAIGLMVLPVSSDWKLVAGVGLGQMIIRSAFKVVQFRRAAEGRVGAFVVNDMATGIGGFAVGAALTWWHFGGASPLAGLGLAAAVSLLLASGGEFKRSRGGRFERGRAWRYLCYGFPLSMSLVLSLVLASTDRFVIAAYLDEAKVGMYFAAFGLAFRPLDILFAWLGTSAFPAVLAAYERQGEAGMQQPARTQVSLMMLFAVPAVAGLWAVATPLSALMVPAAMRDGVSLLMPWMAASALFAGLNGHYLEQAFTLSRRSPMLLASMAIPAAINVALNLLLVPRFGLIGAAWGTTGSLALGSVATWALGRGLVRLPIPVGILVRCILAALAMAAVLSQVPAWGGLAELLAKLAVGVPVYGLALLLTDLAAPTGLRGMLAATVNRKLRPTAVVQA